MQDFEDDIAAVARIDVVPRILEVVCRTTGMGFAAVARVTEDRWVALAVRDEISFGLKPGDELAVKTTICDEIRQSGRGVLISHVAENPVFRDHHTPAQYGFQSYVSVPITHRGAFYGTLCAIDPSPARVENEQIRGMFELFADLIGRHLALQDDLDSSRAALAGEQRTAELREQFIAVLGHDLRNPLAAVDGGVRLLRKAPLDSQSAGIVALMQNSVVRMSGLVDNLLDFARGRLGGGIEVGLTPDPALGEALEQVVAELRSVWPDRAVTVDMAIDRPVACDSRRIAQMFSNLLANALAHGDKAAPVQVVARTDADAFELSVANPGEPIPETAMTRLFQPFKRQSVRADGQGLGLGLYIASEIARAHDGTLSVSSDADETRFTFRMPLR
ncbi:MAG: GAF domain-containing sensor histidine kinase [Caulobacter sp.]|nr:GAF domain-containing sensor histidine kinase [Caulobacter sp.]